MNKAFEQNKSHILGLVRKALEIEREGIEALLERLDTPVVEAVRLIGSCSGKVAVLGMGKSGHVGRKIAATLASTGTPAFFLHPAEALHGDLGMVMRGDVALMLSGSGQTEEMLQLLGPLGRMGIPLVAVTGHPNSELARRAQIHLDVSVPREACPLNLAPTASTTATMVMGDAIAVCLLELKGFQDKDFAQLHPGGSLGKKLLTTAEDIMDKKNLPQVTENTSIEQAVQEIHGKGYGITTITKAQGRLCGAFSLGDLLRLHAKQSNFMQEPVSKYMNPKPHFVTPDTLAAQALFLMESKHIRCVFVCNQQQQPIGMLGIYEVLKAIDY